MPTRLARGEKVKKKTAKRHKTGRTQDYCPGHK